MTSLTPAAAACRTLALLTASLATLTWVGAAEAQQSDDGKAIAEQTERATVYQADYFVQFAPSSALDIVRRVPGFVLEESDEEVRGFSGAAGNLVLNGARPASKSERPSAILARIPARRVLRVEVAPGEAFGSDFAGKSQVINLVMSREGGVDGNAKVALRRLHTGKVMPDVEASALIRTGASTFNLSAGTARGGNVEVGFDDLRRTSDGTRTEYRAKVNDINFRDPFASVTWSLDGGANRSANLNLRYSPGHFTLAQSNRVTPAIGPERDDRLLQDYRNASYELGGDVTRPLGGGAIKLVVLGNRRDRDNLDSNYNRVIGTTIGGFEQFQKARYDEVLGRLSWSHSKIAGFTAEFGSELAYNRLDNATELFMIDSAGMRSRVDLPIDKAVVDEVRTETYANFGRQVTGALRFDTTLAYETSKLGVSGDTTANRSLSFFKPGVTLDWKGGQGWHIQGSMRREVAQLDFYDFISSAELFNDRVNGGNADLVPQRTWEARLTVERPVLGRGQVKLELGHDWGSMLQDRVITDEGFDAPGNIGSGTRKFAALTFDAPLDNLGLKATRLKLTGTVQDSEVRDPLSGLNRAWSGRYPEWEWEVDLRRDLASWSYGLNVSDRAWYSFYRTNEVDNMILERAFGRAFVEYRPDRKTTMRVDVENAFDTAGQRFREFFTPDRASPDPFANEFRNREAHVAVTFSVNRTFGGTARG